MQIEGSVALVTGANRGLGQAFARSLVDLGARRVYAAARHPEEITDSQLTPIMLDITSAEQVTDATRTCGDVNLLINNAVEARQSPLIGAGSLEPARAQMETNYFGTLAMCQAFAPCWLGMAGGIGQHLLHSVLLQRAEHGLEDGSSRWTLVRPVP